jgi:ABC-type uncharacterized transport system permease subunit
MPDSMLLSFSAIITLIPPSLLAMRRNHQPDVIFWMVLIVAIIGPINWIWYSMADIWQTNLPTALWVTVSATMIIFTVVTILTDQTWRLAPLISIYLAALGVIALIWDSAPSKPLDTTINGNNWIGIHIGVSVGTYALVTIAAVAALAAFLQESALKKKQQTSITRILPSVSDCERLEVKLLVLGEIILAIGLFSGMALQYAENKMFLIFDHKTVLSITAFVVIGGLLIAHFRTGLRGKKATRIVLLAYLLLTLGYPGVKFITDVILA